MDETGGGNFGVLSLIKAVETLVARGDTAGARGLYAQWVAEHPDDPLLHAVLFNQSVMLSDAGELEAAVGCLERALALNPDFMPAHINLGRLRERMGSGLLAVQQWSAAAGRLGAVTGQAVSFKVTALNQIARVMEGASQDDTAEEMLRQSLDLDPRQREAAQHFLALRQRQCEWPIVQPSERLDRATLMAGLSPLSIAAYTDDPMLQLALAWHYNRTDVGAPVAPVITQHWAARRGGPLRVGYLSSDMREHAVGHLMAEVLGLHDRTKIEVFAYYCGIPAADAMQARYRASADHWIDISAMDDATAARRIADDGIQILLDINGYTREGRTKLLALRPAPVIANWLGFPGSMGSPYHHYIIADDWIIPPSHEIYYSEKVLRLPCYQPNDRQRKVSERIPSRAEAGLPAEGTVFCSFNGTHKITRFTFERWLTVLGRVPGSVLWLLSANEATQNRLKAHAARRGVAPERLIFAPKLANPDHLARYRLADLFLDTAPYGAHTTASDALWMGVPVLTLDGRGFASRVCGSLVRAAGLPEMICATSEEFIDRAVALGRDRPALARLRARLEAGRESCVLFDTPLLVRRLEDLLAGMWADHLADRLPRPDLANLDVYLEIGCAVDHEAAEVQTMADYEGWWRGLLARRDAWRPVPPDARLMAPQRVRTKKGQPGGSASASRQAASKGGSASAPGRVGTATSRRPSPRVKPSQPGGSESRA